MNNFLKKFDYNLIVYGISFLFIGFIAILYFPMLVEKKITLGVEYILLLGVGIVAVLFNKIERKVRDQIFFLVLSIWAIWVLAIIKWRAVHRSNVLLVVFGLVMLTVLMCRYGLDCIKRKSEIIGIVSENKYICILCMICLILSLPTMKDVALYDASSYYISIQDNIGLDYFDYSFSNIGNYRLCSHTTHGIAIFVLLGELINSSYGMRIANLILYIVSIYCFGMILKKILSYQSEAQILIATSIYAFSPWCLGLIGQTTIDNYALYLVTILLYAFIYKLDILFLLIGWIFCNTKESNVVYYSFFALSIWIVTIAKECYLKGKIVNINYVFEKIKNGVYLVTPSLLWLIMFIQMSKGGSWLTNVKQDRNVVQEASESVAVAGEAVAKTSGVKINGALEEYVHVIGFTWANFFQKIKEIFIFNFSWIIVLGIIIGTIYYCYQKRKDIKREAIDWYLLIPIITIFIVIFIFNIIYLEWDNPRYIMVAIPPLILIGLYIVNMSFNKKMQLVFMPIVALLMLIQCYMFIDPLTYKALSSMGTKDSRFYNRNYRSFQMCIEKMMLDIEPMIDREYSWVVLSFDDRLGPYGNKLYYDRNKKILMHKPSDDSIWLSYPAADNAHFFVYDMRSKDIDLTNKTYFGEYSYMDLDVVCYKNDLKEVEHNNGNE